MGTKTFKQRNKTTNFEPWEQLLLENPTFLKAFVPKVNFYLMFLRFRPLWGGKCSNYTARLPFWSAFQNFKIVNSEIPQFQISEFHNFKISKFRILKIQHFKNKISKVQNVNIQNCKFSNYTARLPFWSTKKHDVATKLISYERYGEILFQKVASGYLLHFAQDGSSKNALQKYLLRNIHQNSEFSKI